MKKHPPTRALQERPNLDQLKRQAKELLRTFLAGEAEAAAEVNAHYRDADRSRFALLTRSSSSRGRMALTVGRSSRPVWKA